MNNVLTIHIGDTGASEPITDIYENYTEKIRSYLKSRTYEQFGDGDARLDLHKFTFSNMSTSMSNYLKTSLQGTLLQRFPEIDPSSLDIEQSYRFEGTLGFTIRFKILNEDLEVSI